MSFSVHGQNVTVVGAARSGIAAALLLAERGARVTLTDAGPELDRARQGSCAMQVSRSSWAGTAAKRSRRPTCSS